MGLDGASPVFRVLVRVLELQDLRIVRGQGRRVVLPKP